MTHSGAEESKMVTSWYVVRFFAIALNDKVDMDKKTYVTHSGAEESEMLLTCML